MAASIKAFFILFALLSISKAHYDHDCDHDSVEQDPEFLDIEEDMRRLEDGGDRLLASSSAFRIYPYYDFVKQSASSSFASYITNELIPPVVDYFRAALKVRYPVAGNLKLTSSKICERTTPSILKTGVAADLFLYVDTFADSSTQIANTKYCYLASGTRRPLVARIMINRNMLPNANGNVLLHEKNMYVMMHETMHGLGFSTNTYKYFVDSNGKTRSGHIKSVSVNGKTRTFLDVPPLTEKLRAHFGCSSLQGALMENGGGSGTSASHFERKVFLYEHMTSGAIDGRRVTEMSLALLEGSGWYDVDYSYAEPYFFGKGQGCSFVTGTSCTTFDEFCSGSSRGCAPHGRGGGSCRSDSISDGCRYYSPDNDYDCENANGEDYARLPDLQVYGRGAGSKCFSGTLNTRSSTSATSFCFKYTCSGSGSSTKVDVQVGSKTITCTSEGQRSIDGYYGTVDCPDPQTFCNGAGKKYCPRNCMGRGSCSSGKCQCKSGYTGVDCALKA
jgi:leishmanolysin